MWDHIIFAEESLRDYEEAGKDGMTWDARSSLMGVVDSNFDKIMGSKPYNDDFDSGAERRVILDYSNPDKLVARC